MESMGYTGKEYLEMAYKAGEIWGMIDADIRGKILRSEIVTIRLIIEGLSDIHGEHQETAQKMLEVYRNDMNAKLNKLARLEEE